MVLGALDNKVIQKFQRVVRSPTSYLYQDVKKALIKACKLNENDRLDILFNRTELGDRKPSEMLSEKRQLLEAYDADNTQTNAVLKKLFLDKLPKQAKTILAANLETNPELLAQSANEVVAALCQTSSQTNAPSQQQLINKIFDQKLNKIIETLQAPNTTTQHTPRQPGGYRSNYYSNRPPFYYRFSDGLRQMYRPRFHTYYQNSTFQPPKKLPDSTSWVGGVGSEVNTGPLFIIYDKTNNITFVVDTGSRASLLQQTFDFETYNGPQDVLAVNHTRLTVQGLTKFDVDLGHLQPYPWVFRVADVPFGIIGCDFLTFYSIQVDVKNKRLSEPERSEFNPLHENTSNRADSATAGFEHCSQSFISHPAVTEQNETDLSPPEERFNVKLKSTNTNIGETNSELKSQLLNREASSASAAQQSKIEPSIKHRPTPLSLTKEQNTVQTKQVSVETQTEWQPLDFEILPPELQPCEPASKTTKPTVEAFAVVHSLNDKTNTPSTLTDATKVKQIPANEMKIIAPKREATALQNTLINNFCRSFSKEHSNNKF